MKLIDKIENSFSDSAFAALLLGLFAGIIIGFIASPIKNGIAIGSYNGSSNIFSDSNNVYNGKKSEKSGK